MTTTATVILDSISPVTGARITTMQLHYPRFIHAQLMTHRAFSRNASSSRAMRTETIIASVEADPAVPVRFGTAQRGMVAGAGDEEHEERCRSQWITASREAVQRADVMRQIGASKETVNRILEPFAHIDVLVTATEWKNFFRLRLAHDTQPDMQLLARTMRDAMDGSTPVEREHHYPYLADDELLDPMVSAARCARISYGRIDGRDVEEESEFAKRLLAAGHLSPFEHQAISAPLALQKSGNFVGWMQWRQVVSR